MHMLRGNKDGGFYRYHTVDMENSYNVASVSQLTCRREDCRRHSAIEIFSIQNPRVINGHFRGSENVVSCSSLVCKNSENCVLWQKNLEKGLFEQPKDEKSCIVDKYHKCQSDRKNVR